MSPRPTASPSLSRCALLGARRAVLIGLAVCAAFAGQVRAASPVAAPPSVVWEDELARLLSEARAGRVPAEAVVDAVLLETRPEEAGRFTGTLRRSLARSGSAADPGADALYRRLVGFPRRAADGLSVARPNLADALRRVDVSLAVAEADAGAELISVCTALAGARLAAPEGAREARRRLQPVLEAALLRDENEARRPLEQAFVDAAPGLEPVFVDALRAVATPRRLELLVGLLGRRGGADGLVLNRVHGLALRLGPVLGDLDLQRVRSHLGSSVAFERIGAAQSAGALEDRGALAGLVSLLRDGEASVRNAAHDALRDISAMTIGPSPERWQGWLAREEAWWRERGAHELERLGSVDRSEAFAILREAAHHRLYRDEIAAAAVPLLADSDPTVVRIALATLEGVRARGVELDIVELLEHPSSIIRAQAGACLRNLTGRMLPQDPLAWRQALAP